MRASFVVIVLTSCVDVAPEHRCATAEDCVLDGVQGHCEPTKYCSFPDADCGALGFRYHKHAGAPGVCVLAPTSPSYPVVNLDQASDQVQSACAPDGAHDVSFEFSTPIPQAMFFDTPGIAAAFSLFAGGCPAKGVAMGCLPPGAGCGAVFYGRLLLEVLPPGTYCLVIDVVNPAAATTVSLRSLPAGRIGVPITSPGQVSGNTCGDPRTTTTMPSCAPSSGPEASFILAMCPQQTLQGVSVQPAAFDAALVLSEGIPAAEMRCANTNGAGAAETVAPPTLGGPGPYWLAVDGAGPGECGAFTLSVGF